MKAKAVSEIYRKLKSKPLITGVLFIALAVGIANITDKALRACYVQRLVGDNTEYLEASAKKSGGTFLTLSAIKGAISIFEGSTMGGEAGATIDVEIGDTVQPMYDFIDVAWKVTFASSAILLTMNLVLQIVFGWGSFWLLLLFLAVAVAWTVRHQFPHQRVVSSFLGKLTRLFVAIVMCIYIGLPLAVAGARHLSEQISAPMIDQGVAEFENLKNETTLKAINDKYFDGGENVKWWDMKKKFEQFKDKAAEFIAWCGNRVVSLVERGLRYCAGMVFDCLVFPGLSLLVVYLSLKKGLSAFGVSNNRSSREDIRWAVEQYLKPGARSDVVDEV